MSRLPKIDMWVAPIGLLFVVGGMLQYVGLLSPTQTNGFVLLLLAALLCRNRLLVQEMRREKILVGFLLYVITLGFILQTPPVNTLAYVYYVACTLVAAMGGRLYCRHFLKTHGPRAVIKVMKVFLALQVVAALLQSYFTDAFVHYSAVLFSSLDAVFGTLFVSSDGSLSSICILLTILAFTTLGTPRDRWLVMSLSAMIIFLGHSKASQGTFVVVAILLVVPRAVPQRMLKAAAVCFVATVVVAIVVVQFDYLRDFLGTTLSHVFYEFAHRFDSDRAGRLAGLGEVLFQPMSVLGHGALTYYNPITKEWLYYAGFSTLYSLYIDTGLLGLVIFAIYYVVRIGRYSTNVYTAVLTLMCLAQFAMFNFALSDMAFVFVLNAFLQLQASVRKPRRSAFLPTRSPRVRDSDVGGRARCVLAWNRGVAF